MFSTCYADKFFIQTADIDLGVHPWNQGEGWVPIGYHDHENDDDMEFYGHYNGNGKIISNLYINRINRRDIRWQGLFGASSGEIKNLGLVDVNVRGNMFVGGLAGSNDGNIKNCYSTGNVSGDAYEIGGLVGFNCKGTIINCYSTGSVSGELSSGGLVESNIGTISNSYWDTQTSKQSDSDGGVGRTTKEMVHPHASNTYKEWDFGNVWAEDSTGKINGGYPYLRFQMSR